MPWPSGVYYGYARLVLKNHYMIYHINKLKKKNHMISIGTENAFDQSSTSFITKTLRKKREGGTFLNL